MQLTLVERWFVHAITKSYRDVVERRLEAQSTILESQRLTQNNRFAILLISLFRYFVLVIELLRARFRIPPQTDAVIFYEDNPNSVAKRIQFLEWNQPDRRFQGISYDSQLCAIPDGCYVGWMMLQLLGIIVLSVLFKPSPLTPHLVRVVRLGLLTLSRTNASTSKTIYLFRIYRIEIPFVSAFLKECGIQVHLVASSSPLSFHNRILIGDSLKACQPYQVDEFQYYRQLGACGSCELWSPETIYQLETRYKDLVVDEHFDTIGVYTQGFLLRDKLGSLNKDFALGAVRREVELLEMVAVFANSHPSVRFIIFPHPMERRHYKKTGEHQFGRFANNSGVEIDFSDFSDSTLQFDRVGLGLTLLSSIGFERIYLGFRTIFYISDLEYINWDVESSYHKIFYTDQSVFLSTIDSARKMTHQEFMYHYFGQKSFRRVNAG